MKKYLLFIIMFLFTNNLFCQQYQTYSFDAEIEDSQILRAEVGSCLDNQNNTHIAWIKDNGLERYLMYTVFDLATSGFTTTQINTGNNTEKKVAPFIVTDENDNPHITYIIKRDESVGINSGNYAIMYAGDLNGNGTFEVSQVSLNSTDPNNDSDNIYNCYVNGRPNIFFENGVLVVSYVSDENTLTSWDQYYIFAKKNGSSWIHSQELNIDENLVGTYDVASGISFPLRTNAAFHGGLVEISNYSPRIVYKSGSSASWTETEIQGYQGFFANSHTQLVVDNDEDVHYLWFNDDNEKFCHSILNNGSNGFVNEYPIAQSPTGSFFPSTIDLVSKKPVFVYKKSSFGNIYIITLDNNNQTTETELVDIGLPFGRVSLHANDGYISLITASESEQKIFLTNLTFNPGCTTDPTANYTSSIYDLEVSFVNTSNTTGSNPSYLWDFGDGNSSTMESPTHTYNNSGTYNSCLTVTDSCGVSSPFCQDIMVSISMVDSVFFGVTDSSCGDPLDTVSVSVLVQNFTNVGGFQMSLHVGNPNVATIVGTSDYNLPNMNSNTFQIVDNGETLLLTWFNSGGVTLADNSPIFNLNIALVGVADETSSVFIDGDPSPFLVFDNNVNSVPTTATAGSVCITPTISNPTIDLINIANPSCFDGSDGMIELTITGGSGNFNVEWDTGDTGLTISNLSSGNYMATITDLVTNLQITTGSIELDQPDEVILNTSSTPEMDNNMNGSASVNVSGGVMPYFYQWNDPSSQITSTAVSLSTGAYNVTVTDANQCTKTASTFVSSEMTIPPPVNNDCADAENIDNLFGQTLNILQTSGIYSNEGANANNSPLFGTECFDDFSTDQTVWFTFIGDGNAYLIETATCNSNNPITYDDTQMAIYSGSSCSNLTSVGCDEDISLAGGNFLSTLTIQTINNTQYYILIDGYDYGLTIGVADGDFCLEVTNLSPNSTSNDLKQKSKIDVFPNPVTDQLLNIQFSGFEATLQWDIRLINTQGQEVRSFVYESNGSQLTLPLNVPYGIYFIKMTSDKYKFVKKIYIEE